MSEPLQDCKTEGKPDPLASADALKVEVVEPTSCEANGDATEEAQEDAKQPTKQDSSDVIEGSAAEITAELDAEKKENGDVDPDSISVTEPKTESNPGNQKNGTECVVSPAHSDADEDDDPRARLKAKRARARVRAKARKAAEAERSTNVVATGPDGTNGGGSEQKKKPKKKARKVAQREGSDRDDYDSGDSDTRSVASLPAVHLEKCEPGLYDQKLPFSQRLEICVTRYRERTKLTNKELKYFNEYLFLGGINAHVPLHYGVDTVDMDPSDVIKAHLTSSKGNVYGSTENLQHYDPCNSEGWEVNWRKVVAGYIAEAVPRMTWQCEDPRKEMRSAVHVVAAFLRYVIQHRVCEEYKEDVKAALKLCGQGRTEMTLIHRAISKLPGFFNECLCGLFADPERPLVVDTERSRCEKEMIFKSAVTVFCGKDVFEKMKSVPHIKTIHSAECDLEVLSVHHATAQEQRIQQAYIHMHSADYNIKMGYITVRHCVLPTFRYYGVPERVPAQAIDRIILDDDILSHLKPGFFLRVTLAELNIGLKFMADYPSIFPTFQTILPQALMRRYKRGPSRKAARTVESVFDEDAYLKEG